MIVVPNVNDGISPTKCAIQSSEIVIMENNESTSESCLANIIRHKYVSIIFKVKFKKKKK